MSRFDYLRAHHDEARLYDAMMAHFPDNRHAAIATTYDFSGAHLIADVGGADGATLRGILTRFAEPRGLVFDCEDVIRSMPNDRLLGGRISLVAGSFFQNVPADADIYMLTRVLHNWSDDDCLSILRVCHSAMGSRSVLLLGEQVLEPDPEKGEPADYLLDAQMMAMFGNSARTRTESEFRSLLTDSNFALRRIIPTTSPVSIIEAAPAQPTILPRITACSGLSRLDWHHADAIERRTIDQLRAHDRVYQYILLRIDRAIEYGTL